MSVELTSFVGRRREVGQVREMLSRGRLVTLTGSGGIGKTRLALKVAAEARRAFPDGVWLVELASLSDGTLLAQTVVDALGLREQSPRPALDILRDFLPGRQALVVLDNCEHLIEPCSALIAALLDASSDLKIVATSRQTLKAGGESVLRVPPLSLPDPEGGPQALVQSEAVRLFTERARSVRPGYAPAGDKMRVIADICRRVEGIPLAIELAAARSRALTVEEILQRLTDRLGLLTDGPRTAVPRQQTLRATIDWSHDMCSEQERLLWSRLSVFSGGWDLEAAEKVCSGNSIRPVEVLDLVANLVDKSVLVCEERGARMWYRMSETLRQYGQEQLAERSEEQTLRRRHRDWYQHLAEQGSRDWYKPPQLDWLARLRDGHANLRAALEYCLATPGQARAALAMAGVLWPFWFAVCSVTEGRSWLDRALAVATEDSSERAKALWATGWFANLQGDPGEALHWLAEARALAMRLGDQSALAWTIQFTALATMSQGDFPRACSLANEAVERQRALSDRIGTAISLIILARALSLREDPHSLEVGEEALTLCEETGNDWTKTYTLWAVGCEMVRRRDTHRATELLSESLRLGRTYGDRLGCACCVEALAWIAGMEGRHERAARLLGAAHILWRALEVSPRFSLPADGAKHDQCEAEARYALGDAAFDKAYTTGDHFSFDDAYAHALDENETTPTTATKHATSEPPSPTKREREVAALVAQGLSNKEIAAELVISRRTAEGHVEHLLTKLGFTSRSQIATWATQQPG
ncbi:ATP-binding protein [Streptomyces sp. NPDC058572]|uniref:ATP-binding protein n=1 Tax=Streptomyces sp. NPDC058572 TaxID=3346546 RepID=UPI003655115C